MMGLQRADADLVMQWHRYSDSGPRGAFLHDGVTSALSHLLEPMLSEQAAKRPA
jgi:hypothetical protein